MNKCSKCGAVISDNDNMAWKCMSCGKAFKVNLSKLKQVQAQKDKPENAGKTLLKCPACGNGMDEGNEKIACKCSACGNVSSGNLKYFVGEEKADKKQPVYNTHSGLIKCPECGREISDSVTRCSYCGFNIQEFESCYKKDKLNAIIKKIGLVIIAFSVLFICINLVSSHFRMKTFEGHVNKFIHHWDRRAEASQKEHKDLLAIDIYEKALQNDMRDISQTYVKFSDKNKANDYLEKHVFKDMFEYVMELLKKNGREYSIDKEFIDFYSNMKR